MLGEEAIKRVLMNSGLTEKEAEVYIFLSQHDVRKGAEIARLLRKDKSQVFRILRSLQAKGFVEATLEFPSRFTVVPFENILDSLVKAKQEEVAFIKSAKKDLLDYISKKRQVETLEKFVVIKGNRRIYSKISQIIRDTKHQLSAATTVPGLMHGDRFGVFDVAFNHPLRSKIQYRFLTELSKENLNALKALVKRVPKTSFNFKVRNPDLGLNLFPRMVTRDNEEILFFTSRPDRADRVGKDDVCLWTNCRSLVQAFGAIFEELWRNSTDIHEKIIELETGKLSSKTYVMSNAETARKKYHETLQLAKEEIMLMTTSKGLIEHWKHRSLLEKWLKNGVQIKIMAPIVHENSEAAEQLQKTCPVRHIPENYMVATIVDGKHFFQFKTPLSEQETLDSIPNFENTFYTNELEYVEKMKTTLNDIWKNARAPSAVTLEAIIGSYGPALPPIVENAARSKTSGIKITDIKPLGTITEKEVLDKIIHAEKIMAKDQAKDFSRMYASIAVAAIHPPDYFNLPEMMIQVQKIEKQSTFGAEDALNIFLWLETPTGHAFVPVATVGDNPKAQQRRKAMFAGSPAGQNVQLVRKDELQVRVHGNTMFAGWTVPIPLYPPYVLPPACLLIEGYGNVKTSGFTMIQPSGFKSMIEENYFDAFVTFMHPSSKYSGPGTDGVFTRDYIMTIFPPKSSSRQQQ
jgi:sugar-specific transcriptional regulator TrmB